MILCFIKPSFYSDNANLVFISNDQKQRRNDSHRLKMTPNVFCFGYSLYCLTAFILSKMIYFKM